MKIYHMFRQHNHFIKLCKVVNNEFTYMCNLIGFCILILVNFDFFWLIKWLIKFFFISTKLFTTNSFISLQPDYKQMRCKYRN